MKPQDGVTSWKETATGESGPEPTFEAPRSARVPEAVIPAPTNDPRFNPTAQEYVPSPGAEGNIPERVTHQQLLAHNETLWNNIGPADTPASAPILAGTKVTR